MSNVRPDTSGHCRSGEYNACTTDGLALLGHELHHVGQYRNGMTEFSYIVEEIISFGHNGHEKTAYAWDAWIELDLKRRYPNGVTCECSK